MAEQRSTKRKKLAAKSEKDTTVTHEKIKLKPETATTPAKAKERARLKSDEPLAKVQKALRAAQAEIKHERQARTRAEKALAEAREELVAARLEVERERQAQIRRVSFVVRLTLDKHGQFVRTEIEHVLSSRKQNFLSLDGEHLVAFMKACISPVSVLEDAISTAAPPEKVTAPTPGPLRPKSSLSISDVRVFRPELPDFVALTLTPEESFVVQARFQLQGPEARSLTAQEPSYEMKVYANEVTSGRSKLITTYSANLIHDVLEYTAPAKMSGLPPGLYRLFTAVILNTPIKMAGFYGETIILVT
jgi:hypothetical protein